jgi:uncharacterized membrane protein (UPF0127 family)
MKGLRLALGLGLLLTCTVGAGGDEGTGSLAEAQARYHANLTEVGRACSLDRDCPSPLRCVEAACAEPAAMVGPGDAATPAIVFYGHENEVVYYLEVADNPLERERGLMDRPSMLSDWGMIFLYPSPRPLTFWMHNTYIPLDMVFIDGECRVVGVVQNAEPLTLTSRAVPGDSQFVVELNAGQAAQHGIDAGVRCDLLNISPESIANSGSD